MPGGRTSTRFTVTGQQYDHGAQFFTATSPLMRRLVAEWVEAGERRTEQAAVVAGQAGAAQLTCAATRPTARRGGRVDAAAGRVRRGQRQLQAARGAERSGAGGGGAGVRGAGRARPRQSPSAAWASAAPPASPHALCLSFRPRSFFDSLRPPSEVGPLYCAVPSADTLVAHLLDDCPATGLPGGPGNTLRLNTRVGAQGGRRGGRREGRGARAPARSLSPPFPHRCTARASTRAAGGWRASACRRGRVGGAGAAPCPLSHPAQPPLRPTPPQQPLLSRRCSPLLLRWAPTAAWTRVWSRAPGTWAPSTPCCSRTHRSRGPVSGGRGGMRGAPACRAPASTCPPARPLASLRHTPLRPQAARATSASRARATACCRSRPGYRA
jgi:hypothetical protein